MSWVWLMVAGGLIIICSLIYSFLDILVLIKAGGSLGDFLGGSIISAVIGAIGSLLFIIGLAGWAISSFTH